MTPRPTVAPAAIATTGRSGNINTNNNRREVGPLQASAVGPKQTAAPSNWIRSSKLPAVSFGPDDSLLRVDPKELDTLRQPVVPKTR
jgi:hypothetical protein